MDTGSRFKGRKKTPGIWFQVTRLKDRGRGERYKKDRVHEQGSWIKTGNKNQGAGFRKKIKKRDNKKSFFRNSEFFHHVI
jgi:hypothetical protein